MGRTQEGDLDAQESCGQNYPRQISYIPLRLEEKLDKYEEIDFDYVQELNVDYGEIREQVLKVERKNDMIPADSLLSCQLYN